MQVQLNLDVLGEKKNVMEKITSSDTLYVRATDCGYLPIRQLPIRFEINPISFVPHGIRWFMIYG